MPGNKKLQNCGNKQRLQSLVFNFLDFMLKLSSPRTFSFLVGLILFLLGLFGFAFRAMFTGIGDRYLLLALVFGFWGLIVSVQKVAD